MTRTDMHRSCGARGQSGVEGGTLPTVVPTGWNPREQLVKERSMESGSEEEAEREDDSRRSRAGPVTSVGSHSAPSYRWKREEG